MSELLKVELSSSAPSSSNDALAQSQAHNYPRDLLRAMRPEQWIKNGFVFLGVVFSGQWHLPQMMWRASSAAIAFCLVSSGVYLLNDLLDMEHDRAHPTKRRRPIAAGRISPTVAWVMLLLLLASGLLWSWTISPVNLSILLLYVAQNIAYSMGLKRIVLLDVFVIAFGFMLRILSGTWGLGISPSHWLLLCGLMLTLCLGFGKRWAEVSQLRGVRSRARYVLGAYDRELLTQLTGICAVGAIITYGLYALDANTIALHQTDRLIYTIPFVIYGVFRYLYLMHRGHSDDPSRLLFKDTHLLATAALWLGSVLLVLN